MELPFIYDRPVAGKNFIGRKGECNAFANLIEAGENIVVYEPPKAGKMSFFQQSLLSMQGGKTFRAVFVNLFNVRKIETFLTLLISKVLEANFISSDDFSAMMDSALSGTVFTFDPEKYSPHGNAFGVSGPVGEADIEAALRFPERVGRERGVRQVIFLTEFQNLLEDPSCEKMFKVFESVNADFKMRGQKFCNFVISGSRVNAMKYIFEDRKFFYRQFEHIPLSPIDEKELLEHIRRGFMSGGKVFEKDQALGVCRLFKYNIWDINHFCAICNSLSPGYINEGTLNDALSDMIAIHQPKFEATMSSLTDFQISLLKAVLEGVSRFSATEVIEKYQLNSSANVKRVKEALLKKEIITFNDRGEPVVMDPLFEYWAKEFYFEMNRE